MRGLGLGLGLGDAAALAQSRGGGGMIVTQTIMRDNRVMHDNLRMTDNG
jgi:hypothetical protein